MSQARDKALEAFPISFSERMGYKSANLPNERRNAFEKGYEQALENLLDVAIECEVSDDWQYGKDADHKTQPAIKLRCPELKIGQKVKVILIRE